MQNILFGQTNPVKVNKLYLLEFIDSMVHSREEIASGLKILLVCWVIFLHYLSLAILNGLVL